MIRYTCDRCKCDINPEDELRYTVHVEIKAVFDSPDFPAPQEEPDHLLELHEILERLDDEDCESICDDVYQRQRYDLCSSCYKLYQLNPLGRDTALPIGFSQN